ncbi:hypothetical protein ACQE98_04180 [Ornithinimicrobium sp. W1679]|uniref:hypothetical protein n=1 Tax=Ornithinimicrobium sp. W1679 TaxID=3418770 RepID=UPI003CE85627
MSTTTTPTRRPAGEDRVHHDVRNAWLSMLLLPVAFVLAFVVGEGLASLLGHPVGGSVEPPPWAVLVSSVPALLVFFLPAVVSAWFARRAARHGDRRGWVPAGILTLVAVGFVALNLAAYFGSELMMG